MPEATFLHIQGAGTRRRGCSSCRRARSGSAEGPIARSGSASPTSARSSACSAAGANLALPAGRAARARLDRRPARRPAAPLAFGVPFRVGDHWLTLRSAATRPRLGLASTPRSPSSPRSARPSPSRGRTPARRRGDAGPATAPGLPTTDEERLRRWEARLEQRERWLKDRQEERRWEARWKSAGESIRARSATPASPPPASPGPSPTPSTVAAPQAPLRPPQTPPVARIIEPRRSEPVRRVADPSSPTLDASGRHPPLPAAGPRSGGRWTPRSSGFRSSRVPLDRRHPRSRSRNRPRPPRAGP